MGTLGRGIYKAHGNIHEPEGVLVVEQRELLIGQFGLSNQ